MISGFFLLSLSWDPNMSLYRLLQGTPWCYPDPEVATGVAQCLRLPTRKAGRTGTSVGQLEEKDNLCWKEDRGKNNPEEQPEDALGVFRDPVHRKYFVCSCFCGSGNGIQDHILSPCPAAVLYWGDFCAPMGHLRMPGGKGREFLCSLLYL